MLSADNNCSKDWLVAGTARVVFPLSDRTDLVRMSRNSARLDCWSPRIQCRSDAGHRALASCRIGSRQGASSTCSSASSFLTIHGHALIPMTTMIGAGREFACRPWRRHPLRRSGRRKWMLSADNICSAFLIDDALRSKPLAWHGILMRRTRVELAVSQALDRAGHCRGAS